MELREFYEHIVEAQRFVQGDLAFEDVANVIASLGTETETNIKNILQKQKDFFDYQLMLETQKKVQPSEWLRIVSTLDHIDKTSRLPGERLVEKADQLTLGVWEHLAEVQPQDIDHVTFSTIPSAFQFFLFSKSVKDFSQFIVTVGKTDKRLCRLYLRCVFWTPSFLGFVSDVFGPHLVRLARSMVSVKQCVQAMKLDLEQGDRLLPGYICRIFQNPSIQQIVGSSQEEFADFLQKSFLCELARAPQRCFACQFYDSYDQKVAQELEELLRSEIAVCLATRLLGDKIQECVAEDSKVYVFNELDAALIKKETLDTPAMKLKTFVVDYTKQEKLNAGWFESRTAGPSWDAVLARDLRQLLKKAPLLPDSLKHLGYTQEQENMKVDGVCAQELIEEWLVNNADAENIVHQTVLFRKVCDKLPDAGLSREDWNKVFVALCPEMATAVKPEKRKLARQLAKVDSLSNVARARAQNVLFFTFVRVWHSQGEQSKFVWGTCRDYVRQGAKQPLSARYKDWSSRFETPGKATTGPGLSACWTQVHLHYAFSVTKFDFHTYCILHPELRAYDNMVAAKLADINALDIVDKVSEAREQLLTFMRRVVRDRELRREAYEVFHENCDPLTKADRMCELLTDRLLAIWDSIPNRGEVTGEIRTALTELFFAYGWRPTCLASVFWFISECKHVLTSRDSASANCPRSLDEVHGRLMTVARERKFDKASWPTWE